MIRRIFAFTSLAVAVLLLSSRMQNVAAAPPSAAEPLGYTQTVVRAAPNISILRVTHTTTDMEPSVQCPAGYRVVGGGFKGSTTALVYSSFKKNNGWQIKAKPYSSPWSSITVYATCLQWSHSITYHTASINLNSLQSGATVSKCSAGEITIGGGQKMNDSRALIFSSVPGADYWYASALNQAGITRKLTVLAICVPEIYTNQNIVSRVVNVPAGSTKSANQGCPHPMFSVMSGGYSAESIYWRVSSFPKDDDTWRVTVRNDHTPDLRSYTIYAACFELTE